MKVYNKILTLLNRRFYDTSVLSYTQDGDSISVKFSYVELHRIGDNTKLTRTAKFLVSKETAFFISERTVVQLVSLT